MILQNWWYTTLLNVSPTVDFCPPLKGDMRADALVIGGGMAGMHAALTLVKKGKSVVLLERNICGGSSTGKSAGFITPDSELELSQLIRRFGAEGARLMWDVPAQGVEMIVRAIRENNLACDFKEQDSVYVGIGRSGKRAVLEEAEAREKLGFPYTLYDSRHTLAPINPGGGYTAGVRYGGTYGINPLQYAQELKGLLQKFGVRIFESSEVERLAGNTAHTHLGSVTADQIIVCIDKMASDFNPISRDIFNAQTFLSISEPIGDDEARDIFPSGDVMCWDSRLVYTYYRLTGDRRILLGGGTALTTFLPYDVTPPTVINRVIRDFKKRFPVARDVRFIQYWPGRIDTTKDLIPVVDWDDRHPMIQYVAGCVGLPWAAFCGSLAAERACDRSYRADLSPFLSRHRAYLIPTWLQRILGKVISFSLNNGYSKYLQKDIKRRPWM